MKGFGNTGTLQSSGKTPASPYPVVKQKGIDLAISKCATGKLSSRPMFMSSTAQSKVASAARDFADSIKSAGPTTTQPKSMSMSSIDMAKIDSSSTTNMRFPIR